MDLDFSKLELERAFQRVCHNEIFSTYRDMEDALGEVAQALLSGWRPEIAGMEGLAAARAGYLIDLLRGWMPAQRAATWDPHLASLAARTGPLPPVPFFHADPIGMRCYDDVARRWGLARGLNVSRLLQSLENTGVRSPTAHPSCY